MSDDENGVWMVERILAHKSLKEAYRLAIVNQPIGYGFFNEKDVERHCDYLYLVKWANYSEDRNTWEPERNFFDNDILEDYKKAHNLPSVHSTFQVKNNKRIFKSPLTLEKWRKIPLPHLGSTSAVPVSAGLNIQKSDKKRSSSKDATPVPNSRKKRQIIFSDDEDDVAEPLMKKRHLSEASVEFGVTSPRDANNASDAEVSIDKLANLLPSTSKHVVEEFENERKEKKYHQKDSSSAPITDEPALEIMKKRKENTLVNNDGSPKKHQKKKSKNVEAEKIDSTDDTPNVKTAVECCTANEVAVEAPSMEDLFGENDDSAFERSAVPSPIPMDTAVPPVPPSNDLRAAQEVVSEKSARVIRYMSQPRAYNREIVLGHVLSFRRWASSEDLMKDHRKEYHAIMRQNRIANFFADVIKEKQLQSGSNLDSKECITVDMKIKPTSTGGYIWKTKTKHMRNILDANCLPNKIPATMYDAPELLGPAKPISTAGCKCEVSSDAPSTDMKRSPITKATFSGVAPIVLNSVNQFIKSMSSLAEIPQLLKLVTAFLNTNPSQLTAVLKEIGPQERLCLMKGLIERLMVHLHEGSLADLEPYQYLITAENAQSTFAVGSNVPDYCGSPTQPHWKCELLRAILRCNPEFSFGEDANSIFPADSLIHCLQYGSICLQCIFASAAPLGVGNAYIGRFKIDSNILPLVRKYSEKSLLPLLLQNGFDPNSLIMDTSEQEIVNIADTLQDLKIDPDNLKILTEHSKVLQNYAEKQLEFALVNHPNLNILDSLTRPHVLRSLGGKEDWVGKYAEIHADTETTAKRILTLNQRIIDEDDLSSKNCLFVLAVNPINMVVSSSDDFDSLLGESHVPVIITPVPATRYRVREAMISFGSKKRKCIQLKLLKSLSSGCDQYFVMDLKDKNLLIPGKIDIQVCFKKQDVLGVSECSDELQSFIVQMFVVSRRS